MQDRRETTLTGDSGDGTGRLHAGSAALCGSAMRQQQDQCQTERTQEKPIKTSFRRKIFSDQLISSTKLLSFPTVGKKERRGKERKEEEKKGSGAKQGFFKEKEQSRAEQVWAGPGGAGLGLIQTCVSYRTDGRSARKIR